MKQREIVEASKGLEKEWLEGLKSKLPDCSKMLEAEKIGQVFLLMQKEDEHFEGQWTVKMLLDLTNDLFH